VCGIHATVQYFFSLRGTKRPYVNLDNYYGVERWLNGGRWTFSRDLIPQKGTGCRSGLLQDGDVRQVPAVEDSKAQLRGDLPARHQLQTAATTAVGTVNVHLYILYISNNHTEKNIL